MPINRKYVVIVGNRFVSQHNKKTEASHVCTRLKKKGFLPHILKRSKKTARATIYRKDRK